MFDRLFCGTTRDRGRDGRTRIDIDNDDCFRPTEDIDREIFIRETRTNTSWHREPDCNFDNVRERRFDNARERS